MRAVRGQPAEADEACRPPLLSGWVNIVGQPVELVDIFDAVEASLGTSCGAT